MTRRDSDLTSPTPEEGRRPSGKTSQAAYPDGSCPWRSVLKPPSTKLTEGAGAWPPCDLTLENRGGEEKAKTGGGEQLSIQAIKLKAA